MLLVRKPAAQASKLSVLVTYGWCRTAFVAVEDLAKHGHRMFVCDASPLAMARFSKYSAGFDLVPDPFLEPRGYAAAVAEICRDRAIDVVLPGHEDALALLEHADLLPSSVRVAAPPLAHLRLGCDKYETVLTAERAGVRVPLTKAPPNFEEVGEACAQLGFPLVVKTRRGNSSKGVRVVSNLAEAVAAVAEFVQAADLPAEAWPLFQEFVDGEVYGCCFIADQGEVRAAFTERYLRCKDGRLGTSVFREPSDWREPEREVVKLAASLGWSGIGHCDFIRDRKTGRAILLEINPRLWGAVRLAVDNGFHFPTAAVGLARGESDLSRYFPGRPEPVRALWLVGEGIALIRDLSSLSVSSLLELPKRLYSKRPGVVFDDFRASDVMPFIAECIYYGLGFMRSGGATNPSRPEMHRADGPPQHRPFEYLASGFYVRTGKRVLDIVVAGVGLLIIAAPLLVIAALICVIDGGPCLFRQERIGRFGRTFRIAKFRTMVVRKRNDSPVTVANDARVTKLGAWLRRWRLDELPQLWNVLWGEMSLVGPRPDVPGFADKLSGQDLLILAVRPGITGPATLAFANEAELLRSVPDPDRYNRETIFPRKVAMNLQYVKSISLRQDLGHVFGTLFPVMILRRTVGALRFSWM